MIYMAPVDPAHFFAPRRWRRWRSSSTCSTAGSRAGGSTHSPLGRELDSLADVISFGVAPAALAFAAGMQRRLGLGGADLLRLLRGQPAGALQRDRRIAVGGGDKVEYFEGTPIPTSVAPGAVLAFAGWQGALGEALYWGGSRSAGELHPLVLLFALSGTPARSRIRHCANRHNIRVAGISIP